MSAFEHHIERRVVGEQILDVAVVDECLRELFTVHVFQFAREIVGEALQRAPFLEDQCTVCDESSRSTTAIARDDAGVWAS